MSSITPASIRNNNPGAIWPGPSAKKFGSTSSELLRWKDEKGRLHEDKCATFPTAVHGAAAMFDLLATSKLYKGKTIEQAIETWCGKNSVGSYLKLLKQHDIDPLDVLEADYLKDARKAITLATAMAKHEAGREFPLPESGWVKAHEMAFGDAAMPAPTATNDVPSISPEARARAEAKNAADTYGPIATVLAGGGGAATTISKMEMTLQQAVSVRGLATGSLAMLAWATENLHLVAAAAVAYVAVAHVLPWWRGRS